MPRAVGDLQGLDRLIKNFQAVVPPEKKKFVWSMMIRKSLQLNRARVRAQRNLDGSPFAKRATQPGKKQNKKKMLRKLLKEGSKPQVRKQSTSDGAVLYTTNPIAAKHQFGQTEVVQAKTHEQLAKMSKTAKNRGVNGGDKSPCSKAQARVLRDQLGFKWLSPNKGSGSKKKVRATLPNLQKAFNQSTAGWLIGVWREAHGKPKRTQWQIKTPKRDVLGLSSTDKKELTRYFALLIFQYSRLEIQRDNAALNAADLLQRHYGNDF